MSDPKKKSEPDEDLLEFLGGIDEVNDESQDGSFTDFLANADIEKIVVTNPPKAPPKEDKHE